MSKCLYCNNDFSYNLTIKEIFSFNPIFEDNLCQLCRSKLKLLSSTNGCPRCFKPEIKTICDDCRFWEDKYNIINCHQSLFGYNQFIHNYFKKYKGYGDILLADLFLKDLLTWSQSNKFDLITYIPASKSHQELRGFDPVWEMYHRVFELTPLLIKVDADKPQAQKNRSERLNTPQTFRCINNQPYSSETRVLLLDDIYTTGRTILHAKMALNAIGLTNIYTFSLSR